MLSLSPSAESSRTHAVTPASSAADARALDPHPSSSPPRPSGPHLIIPACHCYRYAPTHQEPRLPYLTGSGISFPSPRTETETHSVITGLSGSAVVARFRVDVMATTPAGFSVHTPHSHAGCAGPPSPLTPKLKRPSDVLGSPPRTSPASTHSSHPVPAGIERRFPGRRRQLSQAPQASRPVSLVSVTRDLCERNDSAPLL